MDRLRRSWGASAIGVHHPATIRELMRVLKIARSERYRFRRQIARLVDAGDLIRVRGNRFGLADRTHLVVGRLAVNPRGFGFVTPEHGGDDTYVAGVNLDRALHGDRVTVRVERAGDRVEGRIVEVLERANADVVGRYDVDDAGRAYVVPFDERVIMDLRIPAGGKIGAEPGQMVVAAVDRWPAGGRGPVGHLVEVLGRLDDPGVDTKLVIRKYRLPDGHDPDAVAEANRLGEAVAPSDLQGRTDFRAWPTVTIDGETARDFDDAITLETPARRAPAPRRAHRGRRPLRGGRERPGRVGLSARHVGLFPGTGDSHVSGPAGHRPLQSESGRGSARAVLPDGHRRAGPRGSIRAARRRDSFRCENDLCRG